MQIGRMVRTQGVGIYAELDTYTAHCGTCGYETLRIVGARHD